MAEGTFKDRFVAYRPSKTMWFWSTVGSIIVVIILGFTWGGWVTAGSAASSAKAAAEDARAELAANICVHRFLAAPDAATQLTALKDESSYNRDNMLEKGGWVTFAGAEEPIDGAANLCAKQLADAELPAAKPVAEAADASAMAATVTD